MQFSGFGKILRPAPNLTGFTACQFGEAVNLEAVKVNKSLETLPACIGNVSSYLPRGGGMHRLGLAQLSGRHPTVRQTPICQADSQLSG